MNSLLLSEFSKGIIIGFLYFQLTIANDTTMQNIVSFAAFYVIMVLGATFAGMDPIIITNAFMTKTVFTLIDDRIRPDDKVVQSRL